MEEFPNNSLEAKSTPTGKPQLKPVVTSGSASTRKQPLGVRVKNTMFGADAKEIGRYILTSVIIPTTKNLLEDVVTKGINRALYGENGSSHRSSGPNRVYTSYGSAMASPRASSTPPWRTEPQQQAPQPSGRHRTGRDEIVVRERHEANDVLEQLSNYLDQYGLVTYSELYALVGLTGSYTDENWGWTNLAGAGVRRVPEGYLIVLPPAENLK